MEAHTISSAEPNHYHNHKTSSDTESDQLDWDPERNDDDGDLLVDESGPLWYPYHGKDLWKRMKRVR